MTAGRNSPFPGSTSNAKYLLNLFSKMKQEIQQNKRGDTYKDAQYMSDGERTISFLNRYFIYKKVRKVSDAEKVSLQLQHKASADIRDEAEETKEAKEAVIKAQGTEKEKASSTKTKKPKLVIKTAKLKSKIAAIPEEEKDKEETQLLPATAAQATTATIEAEPVKKLKRTIKIKRT